MKLPLSYIVLALLLGLVVGFYVGYGYGVDRGIEPRLPDSGRGEIACTLDARICPDGTSVGRVPPSCEFLPCPTMTAN